jgi:uncharacterized protein with HEPN domain
MLDAVTEALAFVKGKNRQDIENDRMRTLAIIKELEIIGEAASKVTPELKAAYPDIPWTDVVGMRNRLIHGYFDIDLDRVWDTVIDDLAPLHEQLGKIVKV